MNDDELRSAFDDLVHDLPDDRALPATTARRVSRRRGLKLGAGALGGVGAFAVGAALVVGLTSSNQDRLVVPAVTPTATPSPSPATTPAPAPSTAASPEASAVPDGSAAPTADPSPGGTTPPAPTNGPTTPVAPSAEPPVTLRVVLRPDGLGFTDGGSSTSALPFGTDAATVRTAVDRALLPGSERPTPDCGVGSSTVQHEDLFLLLQDGEFVGWVSGSPGLTTGDGIGVGTTLAELRDALPAVAVTEGTLGPEWSTVEGGLAGFLDGTSDSSVVNSIAAGVRCLAR